MPQNDNECTPLTYGEYNAIRALAGMMSVQSYAEMNLKKRLRKIGKWAMLRAAGAMIIKVYEHVLRTVPADRLEGIKCEMMHTKLDIRTSFAGSTPEAENWVCMPESVAVEVCKRAMAMECEMCEKRGKEVKRCKLRKLINKTLMFEPPTPDSGNCIYAEQNIDAALGKSFEELVLEEVME